MAKPEMVETLFTDWKQEGLAEGWARGKAEGKAEGMAEAVLDVLAGRRLPVTKAQRARILKCSDLKILRRWLRRAATAPSVADVVWTRGDALKTHRTAILRGRERGS